MYASKINRFTVVKLTEFVYHQSANKVMIIRRRIIRIIMMMRRIMMRDHHGDIKGQKDSDPARPERSGGGRSGPWIGCVINYI